MRAFDCLVRRVLTASDDVVVRAATKIYTPVRDSNGRVAQSDACALLINRVFLAGGHGREWRLAIQTSDVESIGKLRWSDNQVRTIALYQTLASQPAKHERY